MKPDKIFYLYPDFVILFRTKTLVQMGKSVIDKYQWFPDNKL